MNETSTENAAPAAKVTLRKKAPFTCRYPEHHYFPLTETDGTLCPEHEAAKNAAAKKSDAPIQRDVFADPGQTLAEKHAAADAEWQARLAKGPIWPTDDTTQEVN